MSQRSNISPSTLGVDLTGDAITVRYLDGRRTQYTATPSTTEGALRCPPDRDLHVLVTDDDDAHGVMVYINDRKTHDDILESSGVGRVIIAPNERKEILPGVEVEMDHHTPIVSIDPGAHDGRVFVFAEDARGEQAYEIVQQ